MIRDPSDGSVKGIAPNANEINRKPAKSGPEGITSGLPLPAARDADRHKRSREWLEKRRPKPIETTLSEHYATHNLGFKPKEQALK